MPEKVYRIEIDKGIFIQVTFRTLKNNVTNYVVKLLYEFKDIEYEVARFDSYHNRAHIDIILPDGSINRKIWLLEMNNKDALNNAITEVQKNYEIYIERFKKWLE
jgi:hypothetical protein